MTRITAIRPETSHGERNPFGRLQSTPDEVVPAAEPEVGRNGFSPPGRAVAAGFDCTGGFVDPPLAVVCLAALFSVADDAAGFSGFGVGFGVSGDGAAGAGFFTSAEIASPFAGPVSEVGAPD
ncbi:MAG: hypothetical protein GY791_16470 [Alphaproteobacteria bacterium]|nr:hypothetical protein [Alphaproteobacteria bacterium]